MTALYLIAGLGETGYSIAHYCTQRAMPFILFDTRPSCPQHARFAQDFPQAPIFLKTLPASVEARVTEMIVSPGVPLETPLLLRAKARGCPVVGDIEYLVRAIQAPVIAITGTNGKSTVVSLIGAILATAGYHTMVAGNIGTPVLTALSTDNTYDYWVLELSSFQLDLLTSMRAKVAAILNISADHLDRHHTMEAYIQAKHRIFHHAEHCIYNRDDPLTSVQNGISFGFSAPAAQEWGIITYQNETWLAYGHDRLIPTASMRLQGRHNWHNALAAAACVHAAGVDMTPILETLQSFEGLEHRCQWVREDRGIVYIDDSKGTNVGATQAALTGLGSTRTGKIILIAGGLGKGGDFSLLRPMVMRYVRRLVLMGQDAPCIAAALADTVPIQTVSSMEEAVLQARQAAQPGDCVLLSPACASFDMFRDYHHRGNLFKQIVLDL